jgi:3-deoxy-7-phosphoheptulonate synthase
MQTWWKIVIFLYICWVEKKNAFRIHQTSRTRWFALKDVWTTNSWSTLPIQQNPAYPDMKQLNEALLQLKRLPPLTFPWEIDSLQNSLSTVAEGKGFLLMGGDCAESFSEFSYDHVKGNYDLLQEMATTLSVGGGTPVITIGRMAGQFAKPRSEAFELRQGISLPSYRGDIINNEEFTSLARTPNPKAMLKAYHQSVQTMNILRALQQLQSNLPEMYHLSLIELLSQPSISRFASFGKLLQELYTLTSTMSVSDSFYTGHECLLLPYEECFVVESEGRWIDSSAHFLWIGERTRQLDHAHVHFLSGIANPIGVKISDKITPLELEALIRRLNPNNIPGKLVLIVRMGAEKVKVHLPGMIDRVKQAGMNVIWCSDPVHSNTIRSSNGFKTRHVDHIRSEIRAFHEVCENKKVHFGGIHVEMTGKNVTECVGGNGFGTGVTEDMLNAQYHTRCDPRLNRLQALELALMLAEHIRRVRGCNPLSGIPTL